MHGKLRFRLNRIDVGLMLENFPRLTFSTVVISCVVLSIFDLEMSQPLAGVQPLGHQTQLPLSKMINMGY
jgi:hypothetical protein